MKSKTALIILIVAVVFGGAGFFGGATYSQNTRLKNSRNPFSNGDGEAGIQRFSGMIGQRGAERGRANSNGGFTVGEIIAKDDKSVTVKLVNGSSKIIFFSASTEIEKQATGTIKDLEIGKTIMTNGSANPDGSLTAKSLIPTMA